MKIMKVLIKFILGTFILALVVLVAVVSCYFYVELKSKSKRYDSVKDIPYNHVCMVLGTNPLTKTGSINYFFKYRIDACEVLYKSGKVSKILVSGDNHVKTYDEPQKMKEALMDRGIPDSDIVLDYAGFRTLDSVVRSKEVFCQDKITIVSQGFHNARALCLASWYGIDAVAFDAKDVKHSQTYFFFGVGRESLARVKMMIDLLFNKQPKFLGEKIEI